jgi:diguanylate cyclase (GGDEF)-like protein
MPRLNALHPEARPAAIDGPRVRARAGEPGVDAKVVALARIALPDLASDIAIGDWDALFSAVTARLRLSVGGSPAATPEPPLQGEAVKVRASVLECMTALEQLHTTLAHELGRRQQLELEVFDAQTALAQARADLSGTQAGEQRARHLALHDSLTSLPNRRYFFQQLKLALTREQPQANALAVLYIDLDGFKAINDAHGHDAGDELLRIVAVRLARAVREEDMVSRLGGDEFGCLLADVPGRPQLCHLACKLFDAVSAPVIIGKLRLTVSPSIGIAICPTEGTTAEALLKSADGAMYRAKRDRTGYAFDRCADV